MNASGAGEVETTPKGVAEIALTVVAATVGAVVIATPAIVAFGVGFWFGRRKKQR